MARCRACEVARGEPDIESSAPRARGATATWQSFSGWPDLPEGLDAPSRREGPRAA